MKEAKRAIAGCIAEGATNTAFDLSNQHFPHLQNKLATLEGKYNRLKGKFTAGAMNIESYNTQVAEVTYSLLELLGTSDDKEPKNVSRVQRLISFKTDFLSQVIGEFARSKWVLFGSLAFVVIVGIISAIFISDIMPTSWGKTVLIITLISFFTLVISSLGFLSTQIKQFQGTKSFLKFEEYSVEE